MKLNLFFFFFFTSNDIKELECQCSVSIFKINAVNLKKCLLKIKSYSIFEASFNMFHKIGFKVSSNKSGEKEKQTSKFSMIIEKYR